MPQPCDLDWDCIRDRLAKDPNDQQGWELLFRRAKPYAAAVAAQVLGGVSDLAEDVSSEVFLRLLRNPPFSNLQGKDSLRKYVARIASNCAIDLVRRTSKRREELVENVTQIPAKPSLESIDMAQREAMAHAISKLPPIERKIIDLLRSGSSLTEIAVSLGLGYAATAKRLSRLRLLLGHMDI